MTRKADGKQQKHEHIVSRPRRMKSPDLSDARQTHARQVYRVPGGPLQSTSTLKSPLRAGAPRLGTGMGAAKRRNAGHGKVSPASTPQGGAEEKGHTPAIIGCPPMPTPPTISSLKGCKMNEGTGSCRVRAAGSPTRTVPDQEVTLSQSGTLRPLHQQRWSSPVR
jgi:hypothetical protein